MKAKKMEIRKEINGTTSTRISPNKILRYDPSTDSYNIIVIPSSHNGPPTTIGPITPEMLKMLYSRAWER